MLLQRKSVGYLVTSLGLAFSYFLLGLLGLQFAIPPSYASPLFPSAGLALAALLSLGMRHAAGVAFGAFAVNLLLSHQRGADGVLAPALIALGAARQALAGAWAVRRWVSQPLLLSEPHDLLMFFGVGAILATLISPTVGVGTLWALGLLPAAQVPSNWLHWWLGDTLGVLIAAPIVLSLIGRPRKAWAARRLSVGLPLAFVSALMALATASVAQWDEQKARGNFDRDAATASNALHGLLRAPLMALEGARGLLLVAPALNRADFERGTARYVLPGSSLLAIGLARPVSAQKAAAFNAAAQAEGLIDYRAHNRQRAGDTDTRPDEPMLAIRLIEPLARNSAALGVNILSIPIARAALLQSRQSGLATATAGFPLSQLSGDVTGVVVYQALYAGDSSKTELVGAVFATVRPDVLLSRVAEDVPADLVLCLVDLDPTAVRPRLGGPLGCELSVAGGPRSRLGLAFGGRAWEIRVTAPQGLRLEEARSWPFALVGLLATGLVGALLLTMTGRARQVEVLVRARTAQLHRQAAEREQDALALSESEQRLRNIFDNAPIGIIFADVNGAMQEVNPYFCRLLGYSAEQLQQRRTLDITDPDDKAEDVRLGRQLVNGEIKLYHRHKRYLSADGRTLHARAVVTLLRDHQGKPYRMVGVVEEIGDQLKMQALERARQSAEAANQAKNEFLSRMSHELRTPLNAMLGFAQLLELDAEQRLSPQQLNRTGQIQQAGWHLLNMINDTLDLSRIESGDLKLMTTRLDLAQLLDEAEALVETDALARCLSLERNLAADALHVLGDATRVKQVLTNLLSNAVKYNIDGGSIAISSRAIMGDGPGATAVEISISDTGLGLSEAQQLSLFQPYNRLGRERSSTAGTGIGLVISQRLAEMMGGRLSASSIEGQGSRFALRLPAAPEGRVALPELASPEPQATVYSGRRRVLYIEDHEVNAKLMRGMLAQRQQIDLVVCDSAAAGLAALLAMPPDLLLLDMQLPDMDGLAVLRRLRETDLGQAFPTIVVSANALPEQIRAALAAGARHYVTKPVDLPLLLGLLDDLLQNPTC